MSDVEPTPGHTGVPPECYRHPGRETYVRCTRCDRYICPDCMREASVGFHCPECVAEGSRTVRQPRTVLGGQVRAGTTAVVTYTLIGINLLMYLAQMADDRVTERLAMLGQGLTNAAGRTFGYDGTLVGGIPPGWEHAGVAGGEWFRLISGAFLHSTGGNGSLGITHILFNMWALWALGPQLESMLGRARFLTLYLLSALGGNVLVYLLEPTTFTVGASGAIFGLFAAFFVIGKRLNQPTGGIVFLLVINLVITFAVPGISWQGHVGGLVTGAAVALAYTFGSGASRARLHWGASGAVGLVLLGLALYQTVALT